MADARKNRAGRTAVTAALLGTATLLGGIAPMTAPVAAADIVYSINIDSGTSANIGETITFTPTVTGIGAGIAHRCHMYIQSAQPVAFVRMQVAADDCEPWTVTVPKATPGEFLVAGWLTYGSPDSPMTVVAPEEVLQVTSGTPVPFASNYPVQSWDPEVLLSDATPSFGVPLTIAVPAGVEGCRLSLFAGLAAVRTQQAAGCADWTVSVPAPTPDAVAEFFGDRADVHYMAWTGQSVWSDTNPETARVGALFAETYNSAIPVFAGTLGGPFTSDLPAIFAGSVRGNVYYTDDADSHEVTPVVIGASSGSCTSDRPPYSRPVVDGGCGPFTIPPTIYDGSVMEGFLVRLLDDDGDLIAESSTDIGFVERLPEVIVDVPPETPVGESVDLEASTGAGAPATYLIELSPTTEVAGGTAVAAVPATKTYAGSFTPSAGEGGDTVSVSAAGLAAGSWNVRASFTDVLGATSTTTERIRVGSGDATAPTGSISIAGGASHTRARPVTVSTAATDAGSGLSQVALSHDGVNWSVRGYAPTQSVTLPPTNGTRRVYAKWRDTAGNWSAVKSDTIVLDTVAPSATAPRRGFAAGSAIAGNSIVTRIPWSGTDATSSIARYELQHQVGAGAWTTVSTTLTTPTTNRALATEQTHRFRVRAVDTAGNVGAWVSGDAFRVSRFSETNSRIAYSGSWSVAAATAFWGGQVKASSTAGSRASITFTGRTVAWVASTGPTRGTAEVFVNGSRVATVDLYSAGGVHQKVVWVGSYTTAAARTVSIRVLGTAGHPRVDVDAFVTAD